MGALSILHQLPLSGRNWGGIQVQFAAFLAETRSDPRFQNFLSMDSRALPVEFGRIAETLHKPPFDPRAIGSVSLPKWLRQWRETRRAKSWKIDAVVNTNLFGDLRALRTASGAGAAAIYWERGAAWFPRAKPLPAEFAADHQLLIGNSHASRRMLHEVWRIEAPVELLSPCVWNGSLAESPRSLPNNRPFRLGFAGRLRAFKGGVLAIHALAELMQLGFDAELLVAGEGPDRELMEKVAGQRGLKERVRFLGQVAAMDEFYRRIDLLLHPALREPYGNVCPEAAFSGVPSVVTEVDGLPEAIDDGISGLYVSTELPLAEFSKLGGDVNDVYPLVYRPRTDDVGEPSLPNPNALAEAVLRIAGNCADYDRFSRGAIATASTRSRPSPHIDRFYALMEKAVARQ